jgi:hypothetical protein
MTAEWWENKDIKNNIYSALSTQPLQSHKSSQIYIHLWTLAYF